MSKELDESLFRIFDLIQNESQTNRDLGEQLTWMLFLEGDLTFGEYKTTLTVKGERWMGRKFRGDFEPCELALRVTLEKYQEKDYLDMQVHFDLVDSDPPENVNGYVRSEYSDNRLMMWFQLAMRCAIKDTEMAIVKVLYKEDSTTEEMDRFFNTTFVYDNYVSAKRMKETIIEKIKADDLAWMEKMGIYSDDEFFGDYKPSTATIVIANKMF